MHGHFNDIHLYFSTGWTFCSGHLGQDRVESHNYTVFTENFLNIKKLLYTLYRASAKNGPTQFLESTSVHVAPAFPSMTVVSKYEAVFKFGKAVLKLFVTWWVPIMVQ